MFGTGILMVHDVVYMDRSEKNTLPILWSYAPFESIKNTLSAYL